MRIVIYAEMSADPDLAIAIARIEEKLAALSVLVERFLREMDSYEARLRNVEISHISKGHLYALTTLIIGAISAFTAYLEVRHIW